MVGAIAVWSVAGIYLLWVHYVAVMHLKHLRGEHKLTGAVTVMGYLALGVGLLIDLVVHLVVGSVLFLELPAWGEWTLSGRLWRLSNGLHDTWRRRLALAIRRGLLDQIDPEGVPKG